MARRMSNSPSRGTLLSRRNPAKPGMGGSNRRNTPGNQQALQQYLQKEMQGKMGNGGGGNGLWGGPKQGNASGVGGALRDLGFDAPKGGFGFNADQQTALMAELARITQGAQGRDINYDWNASKGIAGNLGLLERQLGMDAHRIAPLGASFDQRQGFANAMGFQGQLPHNSGPGGPGGGLPPDPTIPGFPGGQGHPRQSPWDRGHGGWDNPDRRDQWPHPQPGPQLPAQQVPPGPMLPAQPVPQPMPPYGYSPGNGPHQPPQQPPPYSESPGNPANGYQPPSFPGYYSPGNPHQGMPQGGQPPPQQGPMGSPPASFGPPQQYQGPPPGSQPGPSYQNPGRPVMPPFSGGASGPPGSSPGGAPYGQYDQLDWDRLNLPNWNQFTKGYYNELPNQPVYLSGAGLVEQQALMNQLRNQQAAFQGQYGQIAPQFNQGAMRIGHDYEQAHNDLEDSLSGRGIFDSSIAPQEMQLQQAGFNRQLQDLTQAGQSQVSDLYAGAGQSFDQTIQALLDLYRQEANRAAEDPHGPYPRKNQKRRNPPKGGKK